MGWIDDVGAKGQDYALTGTFLWIGIMAGEPIVRRHPHEGSKLTRRPINLPVGCRLPSCSRAACLSGQG